MATDMTIVPLLEVPPQTPNSSNTKGAGQQRPPASSAPSQHLSRLAWRSIRAQLCVVMLALCRQNAGKQSAIALEVMKLSCV